MDPTTTAPTGAPNSLLATIQKNSAALAGQQAPMTDATQQAQTLLAAKSGKAGVAGTGTVSNLGEQGSVAATQQQLGQQGQAIDAQTTAGDIAARKQQIDTQNQQAQIAQAGRFDTQQNRIQVQQLMQGLAQDKGNLDVQKDGARLEQTAFLLSMQDKQYVNKLQDVGQRQRLDQEANFRIAQQKMAFGSSLDLLKAKLQGQDISSMSQLDFQKTISDMSVQQALQIGDLERQDAQNQAQTTMDLEKYKSSQAAALSGIQAEGQGLQSLVQAGTQGYNAAAGAQASGVGDDQFQQYKQQAELSGTVPVSYSTFSANKDRLGYGDTSASNQDATLGSSNSMMES